MWGSIVVRLKFSGTCGTVDIELSLILVGMVVLGVRVLDELLCLFHIFTAFVFRNVVAFRWLIKRRNC